MLEARPSHQGAALLEGVGAFGREGAQRREVGEMLVVLNEVQELDAWQRSGRQRAWGCRRCWSWLDAALLAQRLGAEAGVGGDVGSIHVEQTQSKLRAVGLPKDRLRKGYPALAACVDATYLRTGCH